LGMSGSVRGTARDNYTDPLMVPGTFAGTLRVTGNPALPPAAYANGCEWMFDRHIWVYLSVQLCG
ncbi:MAG: hypothetical protein ACKO6M_05685, partial [Bacteroidota bacterium]